MGIRYFALPVPPNSVGRAAASLPDFLASHPWGDEEDSERGEQQSLDLDKCWREFQLIFGPPDAPSPAFELVRGDVTHTSGGWIPFVRFLDPDQVRSISLDLADIDECFVMDGLRGQGPRPDEEFEQTVDYALHYLARAQGFTRRLAASNSGLVYWIG